MRFVPRRPLALVALALATLALACGPKASEPAATEAAPAPAAEAPAPEAAPPGLVEITAADYAFVMPDSIPSGWTKLRFANRGQEPHFVMLTKLPEGATFDDYMGQVTKAFGVGWDALQKGASKAEAGAMIGRELPAWYAEAVVVGGIGIVSPGDTAVTSLDLDPGNYVVECYIKTAERVFHTDLGMVRPLTVTAEDSGMQAPVGDVAVTLTNTEMAVSGTLSPGPHVIAVHFEEQPEAGLGNDVHLAALPEGVEVADIVPWMDWMNLDGLKTPAPTRFLGGTQEGPVGTTAYFEVELAPGRYAFIAESGAERGLLEEFTVPASGEEDAAGEDEASE